jgi:hypothetical protein
MRLRVSKCTEDPEGLVIILFFVRVLPVILGQLTKIWMVLPTVRVLT